MQCNNHMINRLINVQQSNPLASSLAWQTVLAWYWYRCISWRTHAAIVADVHVTKIYCYLYNITTDFCLIFVLSLHRAKLLLARTWGRYQNDILIYMKRAQNVKVNARYPIYTWYISLSWLININCVPTSWLLVATSTHVGHIVNEIDWSW